MVFGSTGPDAVREDGSAERCGAGGCRNSVTGMTQRRSRRTLLRRLVGVAVVVFGVFALFGGLFVPIWVILRDPRVVPAPESWVAVWIIAVGLLIAAWPARRPGPDDHR